MESVDGSVSVELRCSEAELSSPNSIEKLTCVIKNNTDRFITAGTLAVTIVLEEKNGKELDQKSYDTFDTFVHPDFRHDHPNNRIGPGAEYTIYEMPSGYSDVVIKSIAATIDYIDFGDNRPSGFNSKGSQIVADIREGASRYKTWLISKYKQNGKSVDEVSKVLNENLSSREIGLQNSNQESGADMFRKYLLRDFKEKGSEPLKKRLDQ
jgi:hypothetical protein